MKTTNPSIVRPGLPLPSWSSTSSILQPKPGLPQSISPLTPAPVTLQSLAFAIFSCAAPVSSCLLCLPCVWCCDKGPHGSRNDTVSPSPSRCSDRDCLNSILSRGRVPWQLHKYLPAAATPLCLRRACLQATSAMFFFAFFINCCLSQLLYVLFCWLPLVGVDDWLCFHYDCSPLCILEMTGCMLALPFWTRVAHCG